MELFFEAPGADPSKHHLVEFDQVPSATAYGEPEPCERRRMECVASTDWPGPYHGVLDDLDAGPLRGAQQQQIGTFFFPAGSGPVSRAFLFCRYRVTSGHRSHR